MNLNFYSRLDDMDGRRFVGKHMSTKYDKYVDSVWQLHMHTRYDDFIAAHKLTQYDRWVSYIATYVIVNTKWHYLENEVYNKYEICNMCSNI